MAFSVSLTAGGKDGLVSFKQIVMENIIKDVKQQLKTGKLVNFPKLRLQFEVAIRNAYIRGISYAAKNMIGLPSGRGTSSLGIRAGAMSNYNSWASAPVSDSGAEPKGVIYWPTLDYATQQKKGHNQYFIDEGKLKRFLLNNAKSIVNRTGVVSVGGAEIQERTARGTFGETKINLGKMHLKIMPMIPAALLPGIKANDIGKVDESQGFEASVITNDKILQKLAGPSDEKRRHLLQPVFTFWTNYYIPREVQRILEGAFRS